MSFKSLIVDQIILPALNGGQGPFVSQPAFKIPKDGLMVLAGLLVVAGTAFLTTGVFLWLESLYQTYAAASIIGAVLLVCGSGVYFGYQAFQYYKLRKIAAYTKKVGDNALALLEDLSEEIENPVEDNPKTAMLIAGIAGYIAAEKILH
jgi:hypothetical protein